MTDIVSCQVYRAMRQDEMYVYIRDDLSPDNLPKDLLLLVKQLEPVMGLELSPDRKLAREDVKQVIDNLKSQGYHLQMPPDPLQPNLHQGD